MTAWTCVQELLHPEKNGLWLEISAGSCERWLLSRLVLNLI
jgi:hypothetical protein